jgi:hypothetical protein
VGRKIRLEIRSKDGFWNEAFHVEWGYQFPERELIDDSTGYYLAEPEWLPDIESVAGQTLCVVIRAPDDPGRRRWMQSLIRLR